MLAMMARFKPRRPPEDGRPTPERLARAAGDYTLGDPSGRGDRSMGGLLTFRDAPLERALGRHAISPKQYNAGTKFRLHWHRSGLSDALSSVDPNRIFAADSSNFSHMAKTDNEHFHRRQARAAWDELGKTNFDFLEAVICRDRSLVVAGAGLGWEHRTSAIAAATERLRGGLDILAKLWGLS